MFLYNPTPFCSGLLAKHVCVIFVLAKHVCAITAGNAMCQTLLLAHVLAMWWTISPPLH
jgi:hypothetical protein